MLNTPFSDLAFWLIFSVVSGLVLAAHLTARPFQRR